MTNTMQNQNAPPDRKPAISRITRKQFLAWTGGIIGVAVAGVSISRLKPRGTRKEEKPGEYVRMGSKDCPTQNPAFAMLDTQPGKLILYTSTPRKEWRAYSLNATAQLVYCFCDGRRTMDAIAQEYSNASGRAGSEVAGCVASLVQQNLVLVGQTVRTLGEDLQPLVSPGGRWKRI
jgi:hypothetical protein